MSEYLTQIMVESDSIEDTLVKLNNLVPRGKYLPIQFYKSGQDTFTVQSEADTEEEAYMQAGKKLPPRASIISKYVSRQPHRRLETVEASDEAEAEYLGKKHLKGSEFIKSVEVSRAPKQGLFGIGKLPGQYILHIRQRALVVFNYSESAVLIGYYGDAFINEVINAMKAWYRLSAATSTYFMAKGNICDDCRRPAKGLNLRPGHLCCDNCVNIALGTADWETALKDMNAYFGPGVPENILEMVRNHI